MCFPPFVIALTILLAITSCNQDEVLIELTPYPLEGDISKYVPEETYEIRCHNVNAEGGVTYLQIEPVSYAQLALWGLEVKEMDYYLDGKFITSVNKSPYIYDTKTKDLKDGKHYVKAQITIGGEKCNDVTIERTDSFYVYQNNYTSDVDLYMDFNYVGKGDILTVEPEITPRNSSSVPTINEVSYTWDGKLLSRKTSSPFTLSYPITEEADTRHQLDVKLIYSLNGSKRTTNYSIQMNIFRDDYSFCSCSIKSAKKDYKNGETVSFYAKNYKGKKAEDEYKLEVYIDDQLIGTTDTFPYTLNYKLSGLKVGIHKISYKHIKLSEKGSSTSYEYIAVTN